MIGTGSIIGARPATQVFVPANTAVVNALQSSVTKHGNPRLRAALVEFAWRLVRFQPHYKPVVKWRQMLAKGALATGAARKKAIVAVARQLAVDLWESTPAGSMLAARIDNLKQIRGEQKGEHALRK